MEITRSDEIIYSSESVEEEKKTEAVKPTRSVPQMSIQHFFKRKQIGLNHPPLAAKQLKACLSTQLKASRRRLSAKHKPGKGYSNSIKDFFLIPHLLITTIDIMTQTCPE